MGFRFMLGRYIDYGYKGEVSVDVNVNGEVVEYKDMISDGLLFLKTSRHIQVKKLVIKRRTRFWIIFKTLENGTPNR